MSCLLPSHYQQVYIDNKANLLWLWWAHETFRDNHQLQYIVLYAATMLSCSSTPENHSITIFVIREVSLNWLLQLNIVAAYTTMYWRWWVFEYFTCWSQLQKEFICKWQWTCQECDGNQLITYQSCFTYYFLLLKTKQSSSTKVCLGGKVYSIITSSFLRQIGIVNFSIRMR